MKVSPIFEIAQKPRVQQVADAAAPVAVAAIAIAGRGGVSLALPRKGAAAVIARVERHFSSYCHNYDSHMFTH